MEIFHQERKYWFHGIILGVLFIAILQQLATPRPVFRFLFPGFALYLIALWRYGYWRLRQTSEIEFWSALKPVMIAIGFFILFLFSPSPFYRALSLLAGGVLIAISEVFILTKNENINLAFTLFAIYGFLVGVFGFLQYFPQSQIFGILGVAVITAVIFRIQWHHSLLSARQKKILSLFAGIFMAQLVWFLTFLPLHFSALAGVSLCGFYFVAVNLGGDLVQKQEKLFFNFVFPIILMFIIILSTPWQTL